MGIPGDAPVRGPGDRPTATASSTRKRGATNGKGGGSSNGSHKAGHVPYASALVRDPLLEAGYDIRTIQQLLGACGESLTAFDGRCIIERGF